MSDDQEEFSESEYDAMFIGADRERDRIRRILRAPEAVNQARFAMVLALDTDMGPESARRVLADSARARAADAAAASAQPTTSVAGTLPQANQGR